MAEHNQNLDLYEFQVYRISVALFQYPMEKQWKYPKQENRDNKSTPLIFVFILTRKKS